MHTHLNLQRKQELDYKFCLRFYSDQLPSLFVIISHGQCTVFIKHECNVPQKFIGKYVLINGYANKIIRDY